MKKVINFILTLIITVLICLFFISLNLKKVVINSLSKSYVKSEITNKIINEVKNELNIDNYDYLEKLENNISNSDAVLSVTEKYFDSMIDNIINNNSDVPSIKKDLNEILKDNKSYLEENGISIQDSDIDKITDKLTENKNIEKAYKIVLKRVKDNMGDKEIALIKMYNSMITSSFRIKLLVIVILLTILIGIIKKSFYKWTYNLGIAFIISGTILAFLSQILLDVFLDLLGDYNTNLDVNINNIINSGYLCFLLALILIIIYIIGNKITINKSEI